MRTENFHSLDHIEHDIRLIESIRVSSAKPYEQSQVTFKSMCRATSKRIGKSMEASVNQMEENILIK